MQENQEVTPQLNEELNKIIWIASYPKSGNTWMRFLLGNLWYGPEDDGPLPTKELAVQMPGDTNGEWFKRATGKEASDLDTAEQHRLRPKLHEFFCQQERSMFIKTHSAFLHEHGTWHIAPDMTEAVIVVVRDPRDVVVSMMNHFGLDADAAIDLLNEKQNSLPAVDRTIWTRTSDWSVNVCSWATLQHKTFYCRYEDLHASTARCLRLICKHLNVPVDEAKIAKAVKYSSFERLQAEEDAGNFVEASAKAERFFHRGEMGRWMEVLNPAQVGRIEDAHGDVMEKFGYIRSLTPATPCLVA